MTTLTPQNAAQVLRKYGGIEVAPISSAATERGLVLGLFGPGGVGKTTLAATITDSPLGSPALLLNARGNPHVVSSYGDKIDVVNISTFKQVEAVRQDLLKDATHPYRSVILDTVSEMWSIDLRDLYGPTADVDWTKHSASTADVMQLARNWVDLAEPPHCMNVVFVFQETSEERTIRGQKIRRSEIAFNTALQWLIPSVITFLGRLYIIEDTPPYRRMLDFRPVEVMHQAKFQADPKDQLAKDIPMEQYNPSLASLVDTIRGRKPWPTERHLRGARPGSAQP